MIVGNYYVKFITSRDPNVKIQITAYICKHNLNT